MPPAGRLGRENRARAQGSRASNTPSARSRSSPSARRSPSGEPEGFAKLLYGKKHGELLGAHIIGENATELIAEMGLALDQELTSEEIHATIHAHPTMSEVIHEATLAAEGHAIHF